MKPLPLHRIASNPCEVPLRRTGVVLRQRYGAQVDIAPGAGHDLPVCQRSNVRLV